MSAAWEQNAKGPSVALPTEGPSTCVGANAALPYSAFAEAGNTVLAIPREAVETVIQLLIDWLDVADREPGGAIHLELRGEAL